VTLCGVRETRVPVVRWAGSGSVQNREPRTL
jgi:hypothetical protein